MSWKIKILRRPKTDFSKRNGEGNKVITSMVTTHQNSNQIIYSDKEFSESLYFPEINSPCKVYGSIFRRNAILIIIIIDACGKFTVREGCAAQGQITRSMNVYYCRWINEKFSSRRCQLEVWSLLTKICSLPYLNCVTTFDAKRSLLILPFLYILSLSLVLV